jgi:Methyltransferase domain
LSFATLEDGVGSEGRVIGIDQSLEQLAKARALTAHNGWQNITLLNSPVEDARIPVIADAALFYLTHDIMRTPSAVYNIVSSLRDGGRIVAVGRKWGPWWRLLTNWRTWVGRGGLSPPSKHSGSPGSIWKDWFHRSKLSRCFGRGPPGRQVGTCVALACK